MPFPIRYLVPYQVDIIATDLGSGKRITNRLYYQTQNQTTSPPPYGSPILGGGSTSTLVFSVKTLWQSAIMPRLNANYQLNQITIKAILGKRFSNPFLTVASMAGASPIFLTFVTPHGFTTGQTISVSGVNTPTTANGLWVVNVISPTELSLDGSISGAGWDGSGYFQATTGHIEFLYSDLDQVGPYAIAGSVVGDALPLYVSASIRRLNSGIGRSFRSRFSLSPMSEVDSLDGGFTATQKGLMLTALTNFNVAINNGGSDATSGYSQNMAISKKLAFGQPSIFTGFSTWGATVSTMVQQRNTGSIVRRKPKLTSVIS